MEAQSLLLGFSSVQNPTNANIWAIPTSFSSSSSPYQSPNLVSFKAHNLSFIAQTVASNKRLKCKASSTVKVEIGADKVEDLKQRIRRKNLAVFVSGGGSNFRSIHEAILRGSIHGDIVVLVASKLGCGGAEYARDKGIPVILFPEMKDNSRRLSPNELAIALRKHKIDHILLAGYLKLIPAELIRAYPRSILNIHPSLLPAFGGKGYYGMKVHTAVIASGARYSGPTIHFVDEHYDTGRILAQRVIPVLRTDTAVELAARVLREEHGIYVEVAAALCEEWIIWREDGVPLIQSKENPNNYS